MENFFFNSVSPVEKISQYFFTINIFRFFLAKRRKIFCLYFIKCWKVCIVVCYLNLWHNIFLARQHCCMLSQPLAQDLSGTTTLLYVVSIPGTIYFWHDNIVVCCLNLWHKIFLARQHCCMLSQSLAQYISGTTALVYVVPIPGTIYFWHDNIVVCYLNLWHNIFLARQHCCMLSQSLAKYISGTATLLYVVSIPGTIYFWHGNIVVCCLNLRHKIFLARQHCCMLSHSLAQYISGTTTLLYVVSIPGTIYFWHDNIVVWCLNLRHNIFLPRQHCCMLSRPLAQDLSSTTILLSVLSIPGTIFSWSMLRCDESTHFIQQYWIRNHPFSPKCYWRSVPHRTQILSFRSVLTSYNAHGEQMFLKIKIPKLLFM